MRSVVKEIIRDSKAALQIGQVDSLISALDQILELPEVKGNKKRPGLNPGLCKTYLWCCAGQIRI